MPDWFCPKHKHRCLTCCSRLQANCGLRASDFQELSESFEALAEATKDVRAIIDAKNEEIQKAFMAVQIKADIDALYGKDGER